MIDAHATEIVRAEATEAAEIWTMIQPFRINSKADIEMASEMIVEAKSRYRKLDDKEHEITRPLNEALKATRDLFRQPKEYFARIESFFKASIAAHAQAEAERNRLATATAAAAFAAGDKAAVSVALAATTDLKTTAAATGVTTREVEDFEVVDVSQLPMAFLLPNETAIRAALRAGQRVPGVRYFTKTIVAARSVVSQLK